MDAQMGYMVGGERLRGHARAEIGATDADIDDVADRLTAGTAPAAGMDGVAEAAHLLEDGAHIGHHIPIIDEDRAVRLAEIAQGDVQHGASLGVVDRCPGAHLRDPAWHVGGIPQFGQERQGFRGDALLRQVEQPIVTLIPAYREALEARRIGGEQVAQMPTPNAPGVMFQVLPGGRGKQRRHDVTPGWGQWLQPQHHPHLEGLGEEFVVRIGADAIVDLAAHIRQQGDGVKGFAIFRAGPLVVEEQAARRL